MYCGYNTNESDPHSYEATKAVGKKAQKKVWGFNGIRTHELRDTGAMLYQLSYEAGQVWVQFIPVIWREWDVSKVRIPLKPQNLFWAFFATALVASSLRGLLSLVIWFVLFAVWQY